MTARSHTIEIPFGGLNLNDIIRAAREAGYRRGMLDERAKLRGTKRFQRKIIDEYLQAKAQWSALVLAYARQQHVPDDAFPDGAHVHVHIVELDMRRDPDNVTGGTNKAVLDGLVNARILRTDGWKGVLSLHNTWSLGKKPMVRITLTAPDDRDSDTQKSADQT